MTYRHEFAAKILVLDDERLMRLAFSAKLKRIGYDPIAVGTVEEALVIVREQHDDLRAIVTDIMMGEMDGFVFRDIVRGIDPTIPMFFLTALDPEEGGGFLMRILEDPQSFYLPKSVKTDVLLKRIRQIVASRRIEQFIEFKNEETRKSLDLAAHIQRSMLPPRAIRTPRGFYTTLWQPMDVVSGDLYEAVPFGLGSYLYVLGDIQGHGTSAALAMSAVQSFLKTLTHRERAPSFGPAEIANMLQRFFRANLQDISYMTALICVHRPLRGEVEWISCGAPDLVIEDKGVKLPANPENRGGVPIGLLPETIYSKNDVVLSRISQTALCIGFTDGLMDLSRDKEGMEKLPQDLVDQLRTEVSAGIREEGTTMSGPARFLETCKAFGYDQQHDDMTLLVFGATVPIPGVYEATFPLSPDDVDKASRAMGDWCREQGWNDEVVGRLMVVFEEKAMNIHDHGFDDRDRLREVVSVRLRRRADAAELTVWDCGTPEPSIRVVAGDSGTAFDMANQNLNNHGRGRLMVRELCNGIRRARYGELNETVYYVPFAPPPPPPPPPLRRIEELGRL